MITMRILWLSTVALTLCTILDVPARSAEVQGPGSIQTAPQAGPEVPAVRPGAVGPLSVEGEIRGNLVAAGGKVTLRLTRAAARVEVFAGRSKLAALGAGTTFDITPHLSRGAATGLTFHYYEPGGHKSTQVVSPGEIQALSGRRSGKITAADALSSPEPVRAGGEAPGGGPSKSGSGVPASGRTVATDPRLQSQMLSPSVPPGGIREDMTSPQRVGATAIPGGGPVASTDLSSLTVTSPDQGDFMVEGGQFVLQWSRYGNMPENCVNIDLFQGISHIMSIAQNVCVNGYDWQLPQGMYGTGYKVRIRTVDNAFSDDSDPFSIIPSQPDLAVTDLHIQPAAPDQADEFSVRGNIVNLGHADTGPADVEVRIETTGGGWSRVRTLAVPNLGFGGRLPFNETFGPVVTTELTATVEVQPQGQITEVDQGNNTAQLVFPVVQLPNLIACVWEDTYTHIWTNVHIRFRVKNYSFVGTGPFVFRTYVENKGQVSHAVPALGPFETHDITRTVYFHQAGTRDTWGEADYTGIIRESYENDNKKTGVIHSSGIIGSYPSPYPDCN